MTAFCKNRGQSSGSIRDAIFFNWFTVTLSKTLLHEVSLKEMFKRSQSHTIGICTDTSDCERHCYQNNEQTEFLSEFPSAEIGFHQKPSQDYVTLEDRTWSF